MATRKTDQFEPADDPSVFTKKGRKSVVDEIFFDEFGHYPEMKFKTKLSKAQQDFMDKAHQVGGYSTMSLANDGRAHSAWHRTANSLMNKGLIFICSNGSSFVADPRRDKI